MNFARQNRITFTKPDPSAKKYDFFFGGMYNKCIYIFAYPEYRSFIWVFPVTDQCYVVLNLALFGNWIDFNFKSSLDIAVYIYKLQCSQYMDLSVICVVFLWSVSIDKAYLNVLVLISKLLGQSILGMRQLPRMNILVIGLISISNHH
jgi:hypothetical protein